MEKNMDEVKSDLQGISDFMDDFKKNHDQNVKDINQIKTKISTVANDFEDQTTELKQEIKHALSDAKRETEELRNTVIDLQCRSMKYNLVFTGLRECEIENTEQLVRNFIRNELRINYRLELGNVHRFGSGAAPGKHGKPRPIVAIFLYHRDKATVFYLFRRIKEKNQTQKIIDQSLFLVTWENCSHIKF